MSVYVMNSHTSDTFVVFYQMIDFFKYLDWSIYERCVLWSIHARTVLWASSCPWSWLFSCAVRNWQGTFFALLLFEGWSHMLKNWDCRDVTTHTNNYCLILCTIHVNINNAISTRYITIWLKLWGSYVVTSLLVGHLGSQPIPNQLSYLTC